MIKNLEKVEKVYSFEWNWVNVEFKNWFLAPQSDWAVVVNIWWISLLWVCVYNKSPNENNDFFPLTVEFKENYYSWWKIWWWMFNKREWKPSENSILISRLTDRPIRPMFDDWIINDIVLNINTLTVDKKNNPWVSSIIAASLSIMIAWLPFEWPVSAVRIWYKDWKYIINPNYDELENWDLNLLIAWSQDTITMVECSAKEIDLQILLWAFEIWQVEIKKICDHQIEFLKLLNIETKQLNIILPSQTLINDVQQIVWNENLEKFFFTNKKEFNFNYENIEKIVMDYYKEKIEQKENNITKNILKQTVFKIVKKFIRNKILEQKIRVDWRQTEQIRPLYCEVWTIKNVHGSSVFQRWETQVLSILTLWAPWDEEIVDTVEFDDKSKTFLHHYNMPWFSTNEAKPTRYVSRREIWHWNLAEKAISHVIPDKELFPYTIRLVSEVLSSNWSTSMASVCASSLSLMDWWVPITNVVSWIAMWLIYKDKENYQILTDIQWIEDFVWDMDFKVAWTKTWITALQMDMKIKWLDITIVKKAIENANIWRDEILEFMLKTINKPREKISENAPVVYKIKYEPTQVREIIWPWGSIINEIIKKTWAKIDFLDDWTTFITVKNSKSLEYTLELIWNIIRIPKIWEKMEWTITRIENYWLFVKIWNWKTWLCHKSWLWKWIINDLRTIYREWDRIMVEIVGIESDWKIKLNKSL